MQAKDKNAVGKKKRNLINIFFYFKCFKYSKFPQCIMLKTYAYYF